MGSVRVALLSFERGETLREALLSLKGQSRPPEGIRILDNGSGPEVRRRVEDLLGPGVEFVPSDRNRGVHWNLRRAFAAADFDYLYVMHDDDRLKATFLEEQVRYLEENPRLAAVACNAEEIGPGGEPLGTYLHNPARRRETETYASVPDMLRLYMRSYMAFPTVVYRAPGPGPEAVREEYGAVLDVVLLCELARKGPLAYRNRPLLEYRVHGGQTSSSFREEDLAALDGYFRDRGREYPELAGEIGRYLWRRRLSRKWKRIRRILGVG
jgi:glycosyltransferase involved in cell wall biosynthesis